MTHHCLGGQPTVATDVQRGTEALGQTGSKSISKWPGLVGLEEQHQHLGHGRVRPGAV